MDFAQVEARVARLRQDLAAGRLTENQFNFQLREMMVEDDDGNWWMVGYETGEWYRHDGTDWVRANPPRSLATRPLPRLNLQTTNAAKLQPRRFKGAVFVLGLIVTGVVGLLAGQLAFGALFDHNETMTWVFAGAVWISGLVVTLIATRKAWRGK